jgi:competence protein ComGE
MYKNSNGFSLVESLVALSAVLIITGFLLPGMLHYTSQLVELEREVQALNYLSEELENVIINNEKINRTIEHEGVVYELYWKEGKAGEEICAEYYNMSHEKMPVCLERDQ